MLKVATLAAAFLSMAVSAASAQTVEFRGGGFLTNPTAACANAGLPEVLYVSTRYRPPTLGDNGPETRFAVFQPLFLASSYSLASGNLNPTLKNVQGGLTGIGTAAFDAKMSMASRTPTTVSLSTQSVVMSGKIRNYADNTNCTYDYDVSMTRVPG
jgi:hypothetical protein